MRLRKTAPIANMSRSLPTVLSARAHLAEGQCLLQGQTLKNQRSLIIIIIIIICRPFHKPHYYKNVLILFKVGMGCSTLRTFEQQKLQKGKCQHKNDAFMNIYVLKTIKWVSLLS
jgi:hypothetical protein